MEGILKFDLNDKDDREAHRRAIKATDLAIVLWEFSVNSRKHIEKQVENAIDQLPNLDAWDAIELVYSELNSLLEAHNVNIDEIIS